MKKILFISPAFANNGVVCKYDKRYIDTWKNLCDFVIATKRMKDIQNFPYEIIESFDFFSNVLQLFQWRFLNGKEIIVPDNGIITTLPFLRKRCRDYLKNNKVDAIHTVSFPCSSHLLGAELKKEFAIPWIAHFYDPWIDNPIRNVPKYNRLKDINMENIVAKNADAIIHSNSIIKDCWIERYGKCINKKIHIIPFGYSDEQMKAFNSFDGNLPQSDKIVLTYIGTCAGDRNFSSLIKAVEKLTNRVQNVNNKIEIRLLGNLLPTDKVLIGEKNLWSIFNFIGYQSQSELLRYYKESDIFIVIDSPQKRNVFFPSKLIDYFYYQKPILGISPKIGVTNYFLTESGNFCYENDNIDGITSYFENLIYDFSSILNYDKRYYLNFSPEKLKQEYSKILESIFNK